MPRAQKSDAGKPAPAKKAAAPVKKATSHAVEPAGKADAKGASTVKKAAAGDPNDKFIEEQRALLVTERAEYTEKADELKAEADLLARDSEPGDIQFDEEGGEGGNANVERELDLVLSAQARAAVDEIDRALTKIDNGTYGVCETCGQPIPRARLKALPYASLCVQCKSGGLSRR
jgi:DnaK suppressor protein